MLGDSVVGLIVASRGCFVCLLVFFGVVVVMLDECSFISVVCRFVVSVFDCAFVCWFVIYLLFACCYLLLLVALLGCVCSSCFVG